MEREYHEKTIKKQTLRIQVHFRKDLVRKKNKKFRAETNFFQNINVSQDYQFFKTLKTYYKNSTCY